MTEEQVTKSILKWLIDNNWNIICFDFPQSGTGRLLHPNNSHSEKNKGAINPDIVAVKNNQCVFFENKDRFYYPDFEKVNNLIVNNEYSNAINALLSNYNISEINYGIGIPRKKYTSKVAEFSKLVDFIIGVDEDKSILILENSGNVYF